MRYLIAQWGLFMRKILATMLAASATCLAAAPAQAATVVNGGFDSCATTGYTASGIAGASSSISGFAAQGAGCFGYVQTGSGVGVYSTLSQLIALTAGETLTGIVGYSTNESVGGLTYNDDGYLSIGGVNLFIANTANGPSTGWQNFSFVAPTAGNYLLEIGVRNIGDNSINSYVAVDNISTLAGAVPEPSLWLAMIFGFGLIGGILRRRQLPLTLAKI